VQQQNGIAKSTVDYLTCTTRSDAQSASLVSALLEELGAEYLFQERSRRWQFMGYHGRAYEGVRYGLRGNEAIVMLSGQSASRLWSKVAPLRNQCTRIDLAVTATLPKVNEYVARAGYESALDNGAVKGALIANSQGGTTVYLGSRTSRLFGRLYDKGAEEGIGSGICWRYEVECKKPASEAVLSQLLVTEEPALWISSYVWNWFNGKGVEPIFTSSDVDSAIEIEASVSSSTKSLAWLSSQVRPTVGRLVIEGLTIEVLDALGLTNYVTSREEL